MRFLPLERASVLVTTTVRNTLQNGVISLNINTLSITYMPRHFKSSKIVTPDKKKERSAITIVRSILGDEHVDYHLGENDKTADIDGYIAIADSNSCFEAKIEVQIKTLPKKYFDNPAFDCPTTLLGYAESSVVPVVLMVSDRKRDKVWCKHLKHSLIKSLQNKASQKTIKLSFDASCEDLNQSNVSMFLESWREEYNSIYNKLENYEIKEERVKQLEDLLSKSVNPNLDLPEHEVKILQELIDRFNYLLDYDFLFIKKHNYLNLWKKGLALFDYQSNSLVYSLFPIKFGENSLLIKRIPYDSIKGLMGIDTSILNAQDYVSQYLLSNPIKKNPSLFISNLIKAECEKMLKSHDVLPEDELFYTEYIKALFSDRSLASQYIDDIDSLIIIVSRRGQISRKVSGFSINTLRALHYLKWLKQNGLDKLPELYPHRDIKNPTSSSYASYYSYECAKRKLQIVFTKAIEQYTSFINKHFARIKDKLLIYKGAEYLRVFLNQSNGHLMAMAIMYKRRDGERTGSIIIDYESGDPFKNREHIVNKNGEDYVCIGLQSLQPSVLVYQDLNLISAFDLFLKEAFDNYFGQALNITPLEAIF